MRLPTCEGHLAPFAPAGRPLAPTVPLAPENFRAPPLYCMAGITPGRLRSAQEIAHDADVSQLAEARGLRAEPDRAVARTMAQLALQAIE